MDNALIDPKNEMKINAAELKKILVPGTECCLLGGNGVTKDITVTGNNILRFEGKLISWDWLASTLICCRKTCRIVFSPDRHITFSEGVLVEENCWGGRRVPGPGKKIGRPTKDASKKKKPVSVSLDLDTIQLIEKIRVLTGESKSELIRRLIHAESSSTIVY